MKHNSDFRYDLKLGQKGEGYLEKILKLKYFIYFYEKKYYRLVYLNLY